MLTNLIALALLDSQIAEIFRSPFVVPVAGCAMIGSIAVSRMWSGVRTREIQSQERLARIAQGLPPDPEWNQEMVAQALTQPTAQAAPSQKAWGQPSDGAGARRAGLILCAIGVGLMFFFAFLAMVLRERDVLSGAAAGILPLAVGGGFLVDARARTRAYDRWMETMRLREPNFGSVPVSSLPGNAPPPPPPTLTPAQASDWRPLH